MAINQGGYFSAQGSCCSMAHSPQCKLQSINMGSDVREQGSKNRSRTDSAQGAIVNWFGSVGKQMAVLPGSQANSTHKWACAQYCPLQGDFMSSIMIGDGNKGYFDKPKDEGTATVTQPKAIGGATKTCENWQWTETILGFIPMQKTNFYVDMSANPPAPFFSASTIKPCAAAFFFGRCAPPCGLLRRPASAHPAVDPSTPQLQLAHR